MALTRAFQDRSADRCFALQVSAVFVAQVRVPQLTRVSAFDACFTLPREQARSAQDADHSKTTGRGTGIDDHDGAGLHGPFGDHARNGRGSQDLSLIHISEPTRLGMISYAVFCL